MEQKSPAHWTLALLESLQPEQLFTLTRRVIATLGVCRVLLGRCLIVLGSSGAAREFVWQAAVPDPGWVSWLLTGIPDESAAALSGVGSPEKSL